MSAMGSHPVDTRPASVPAAPAVLSAMAWPPEMLGQAMEAIAERVVPKQRPRRLSPAPQGIGEANALDLSRWIEDAGARLGVIVEPKDRTLLRAESLLAEGGPVLVVTPAEHGRRFFILLGLCARGRQVELLAPSRGVVRVSTTEVDSALAGDQSVPNQIAAFCAQARLSRDGARTAERILSARTGKGELCFGFSFAPAQTGFSARFVEAGAVRVLGTSIAFYLIAFALYIASWWLIGSAAMEGHLSRGWLLAWAIMLLTFVVCRGVAIWGAGRLAVHIGGLTREGLLAGILRLSPDTVRARGIGSLFGVVLDADALDALARTGGPTLLADVVQCACGAIVLLLGAAPIMHGLLLLLSLLLAAFLVRRLYRRVLAWADARLMLTDDLVETMIGYRTMVAQVPPANRHLGEDRVLGDYARKEAAMDHEMSRLAVLIPRGWLIVAVAALVPSFAATRGGTPLVAVSLGGIMLVYLALRRVALETGPGLAAAFVAWRGTRPIAAAASVPDGPAEQVAVLPTEIDDATQGRRALLVGRDVSYRYPGRLEPVLRGADFEVRRGDRVLVEGASGSGKSTLGALLCGVRQPSGGLLLLGGFDHHSLRPERWRQRVASVPQAHENHILSAPLLFNIAMARCWPPSNDDVAEFEQICTELGLSGLLARMPAGIQQMVGDSGWQLSQGERARVCIARALAQQADIRVLDESFATLDPETLDLVLGCILRRSETLLVVSHA
jgi:ATP-binding cassette subfamily B protein